MTDETELLKAARIVVECAPRYGELLSDMPDLRDSRLVDALHDLKALLPPKPVTHRCIRPGCDGVPVVLYGAYKAPQKHSAFVNCDECGLRSRQEYSHINDDVAKQIALQTWYNNDTGLPDD